MGGVWDPDEWDRVWAESVARRDVLQDKLNRLLAAQGSLLMDRVWCELLWDCSERFWNN